MEHSHEELEERLEMFEFELLRLPLVQATYQQRIQRMQMQPSRQKFAKCTTIPRKLIDNILKFEN
jgi:ribosomal protein L29